MLVAERFLRIFGKKKRPLMRALFVAEAEGFEPPVPCGTPVFKTGAIDQLCQTSVRLQIYVIHFKMFRILRFNQHDVEHERFRISPFE